MSLGVYLLQELDGFIPDEKDKWYGRNVDAYYNMNINAWVGERFSANITHNMTEMASAVGLYRPLWRPEEIGLKHAKDLIPILDMGLAMLKSGGKEKYTKYEPENKWGSYKGFVDFVESYLNACIKYPNTLICAER